MNKKNMRITVNEMEDTQTFRAIPEREYRNFFGNLFNWEHIKNFVATGDSTSIDVAIILINDDSYIFSFSIDNAKITTYINQYTFSDVNIIEDHIYTMDTFLGRGFLTLDTIDFTDASESKDYELTLTDYADFKEKCTSEMIFKLDMFSKVGTLV